MIQHQFEILLQENKTIDKYDLSTAMCNPFRNGEPFSQLLNKIHNIFTSTKHRIMSAST